MHVIQAHHKKISTDFRKWKPLEGNQLKYVYLIDKESTLTKQVLEYSEIDSYGAGMYKGKKISLKERKVA